MPGMTLSISTAGVLATRSAAPVAQGAGWRRVPGQGSRGG